MSFLTNSKIYHHHLFLKRLFLPRSARVRPLPISLLFMNIHEEKLESRGKFISERQVFIGPLNKQLLEKWFN